ncbi:MAG: Rne/Rng family ribonuclease [Parvibaculales bacterium]
MTKRMLIDAVHPEETRVVVLNNNQIDEFDFESSAKSPLRGNIYLAKVTRVEPSLQAAFVEYGGNRHGFLAFNEIHPDYYQIPVSDREELLREQAEEDRENAASHDAETEDGDSEGGENGEDNEENGEAGDVEDVGGDAHEEASTPLSRRALYRKYKIQEVIKRRQIILVQVLKEERGNKGAALTTYLSLAGRYCVLMPNTARGGGISRKINNATDRKKLKTIVGKLDVPDGMGLIVRTAGAQRTLAEIRRDWQYLWRLWENVREITVNSSAPALVYEEGNLIQRCIRDIYSKDFEEVVVSGADGYKLARSYMKLLMPSHARKVKQHTDTDALFRQTSVEDKLAAMFNPVVTLPSGGYLVINQTEALVAVDVNSGKSTREYSVEKTALATNLEAATEVARQARLRDLAGLLVIDFIDMDEGRNNRAVEKRLKEALKIDRARIQVGRISSFGLLEMSRQRMRSGVLEGSSETCPHCNGSGMLRSVESRALHVLRQIDERVGKYSEGVLSVHVPEDVATYLLNNKRTQLLDIETQSGLRVMVQADRDLTAMEMAFTLPDQTESEGTMRMEGDPAALADDAAAAKPKRNRRRTNKAQQERSEEPVAEDGEETGEETDRATADSEDGDEGKTKRRRRRGRRGGRRRRRSEDGEATASDENSDENSADAIASEAESDAESDAVTEAETGDETAPVEMDAADAESKADDSADDSAAADENTDTVVEMAVNEGAREAINDTSDDTSDDAEAGPARKGWWRRS